jgi:hypothetical protein
MRGTVSLPSAFRLRSVPIPTAKECRHNAEICLKLADEAREIYTRNALIELAESFRSLARHLEHSIALTTFPATRGGRS